MRISTLRRAHRCARLVFFANANAAAAGFRAGKSLQIQVARMSGFRPSASVTSLRMCVSEPKAIVPTLISQPVLPGSVWTLVSPFRRDFSWAVNGADSSVRRRRSCWPIMAGRSAPMRRSGRCRPAILWSGRVPANSSPTAGRISMQGPEPAELRGRRWPGSLHRVPPVSVLAHHQITGIVIHA